MMKVEARIRALREANGWTRQQVADLLHIREGTYTAYEEECGQMPVEVLVDLSWIYHTSTDYLLGRTEIPSPHPSDERW